MPGQVGAVFSPTVVGMSDFIVVTGSIILALLTIGRSCEPLFKESCLIIFGRKLHCALPRAGGLFCGAGVLSVGVAWGAHRFFY